MHEEVNNFFFSDTNCVIEDIDIIISQQHCTSPTHLANLEYESLVRMVHWKKNKLVLSENDPN